LLLAAYEHRGIFESLELIRVLVSDPGAVDALIQRGELASPDGETWTLGYYWSLYDSEGRFLLSRIDRKSQEQRLAEADEKLERGEPLTNADYQARHRAKEAGIVIPYGKPRTLTSAGDDDNDDETRSKTMTMTNGVRADVSITSDHGHPETTRPFLEEEDPEDEIHVLAGELQGYPVTPGQGRLLRNYRVKLARGDWQLVRWALETTPNPKERGWLQVVGDRIKAEARGPA
jgi:hypothetical protein